MSTSGSNMNKMQVATSQITDPGNNKIKQHTMSTYSFQSIEVMQYA